MELSLLLLTVLLLVVMALAADAARRTRGVQNVQTAYRNSVVAAVLAALGFLGGAVVLAMHARSRF